MKTLLVAVVALLVTVSLSAIGTNNKLAPLTEDGYSNNFQDTTKKKDKKKKDSTEKRDTTAVALYHH